MKLQTTKENKHQELLSLVNPLIDFMLENNYHYFLVAGEGGTCTRHLSGEYDDIGGMIRGMMDINPGIRDMLKDIVNGHENNKSTI